MPGSAVSAQIKRDSKSVRLCSRLMHARTRADSNWKGDTAAAAASVVVIVVVHFVVRVSCMRRRASHIRTRRRERREKGYALSDVVSFSLNFGLQPAVLLVCALFFYRHVVPGKESVEPRVLWNVVQRSLICMHQGSLSSVLFVTLFPVPSLIFSLPLSLFFLVVASAMQCSAVRCGAVSGSPTLGSRNSRCGPIQVLVRGDMRDGRAREPRKRRQWMSACASDQKQNCQKEKKREKERESVSVFE